MSRWLVLNKHHSHLRCSGPYQSWYVHIKIVKDSEDATSKHRSLTGTPMPESVTTRCNNQNYTARCGGHPQSAQPRLGEYDIGTIIRENTNERVDAVGAINRRCINGCIGVYR